MEAEARLPPGGAVTGWASLRLHGGNHFDGLGPDMQPLPIPVALPEHLDVRRHPSIKKLRSPLAPYEILEVHEIWVTEPRRALFDAMAGARDWRAAVAQGSVACSAGLVDLAAFKRYVTRRRCIAGIVRVRKALEYVDDRVRSPREAELCLSWRVDAGLPRPLMNWPVFAPDGTYLGAPDLLAPEVGVYGEYDGQDHAEAEAREVDAERDMRFRAVGLTGFRMGKVTFANRRRRVERMLAALAAARRARLPATYVLGTDPEPVVARELARGGRPDRAY